MDFRHHFATHCSALYIKYYSVNACFDISNYITVSWHLTRSGSNIYKYTNSNSCWNQLNDIYMFDIFCCNTPQSKCSVAVLSYSAHMHYRPKLTFVVSFSKHVFRTSSTTVSITPVLQMTRSRKFAHTHLFTNKHTLASHACVCMRARALCIYECGNNSFYCVRKHTRTALSARRAWARARDHSWPSARARAPVYSTRRGMEVARARALHIRQQTHCALEVRQLKRERDRDRDRKLHARSPKAR